MADSDRGGRGQWQIVMGGVVADSKRRGGSGRER